jgi:hypothetical protein
LPSQNKADGRKPDWLYRFKKSLSKRYNFTPLASRHVLKNFSYEIKIYQTLGNGQVALT